MATQTTKRGDWKSVDGMYWFTREQAIEARDDFTARTLGGFRTRIRYFSTLGYSVQAFVPRADRTQGDR